MHVTKSILIKRVENLFLETGEKKVPMVRGPEEKEEIKRATSVVMIGNALI